MDYKMDYRLMKVDDGSKCPKCSFIGRNFLIINDTLSACMDCGCVFIPKKKRLEIRQEIAERQKDIPIEPKGESPKSEIVVNPDSLKCDYPGCDFTAKIPVALAGHKRKHARPSIES